MMNSALGKTGPGIGRLWRWLMLAPLAVFVMYVALRGMGESFEHDGFPEALAVKLEVLPIIFPAHMITGGLALLLVPLVLALRGTRWHRPVGRVAAIDIAIAGVTAIPVAVVLPVTVVSAAGFAAQGALWLVLLAYGIWSIRRRRVAGHRAAMLLMAAVTSGAVFFRVFLGLWKAFGGSAHFETFYAADAWIAWGLPLLAMAAWLHWSKRPTRGRMPNPDDGFTAGPTSTVPIQR